MPGCPKGGPTHGGGSVLPCPWQPPSADRCWLSWLDLFSPAARRNTAQARNNRLSISSVSFASCSLILFAPFPPKEARHSSSVIMSDHDFPSGTQASYAHLDDWARCSQDELLGEAPASFSDFCLSLVCGAPCAAPGDPDCISYSSVLPLPLSPSWPLGMLADCSAAACCPGPLFLTPICPSMDSWSGPTGGRPPVGHLTWEGPQLCFPFPSVFFFFLILSFDCTVQCAGS